MKYNVVRKWLIISNTLVDLPCLGVCMVRSKQEPEVGI